MRDRRRMYHKSQQIFVIILVLICLGSIINYMNIVSSPAINNTRLYIPRIIPKSSSTSHRKAHIVLVENRDLATQKSYGYYTFVMWKLYTDFICHDCNLLVYNSSNLCETIGNNKENDNAKQQSCIGYNGRRVSPYWMKVQAVRNAMDEADEGDLIIFMDTDNQILNANFTLNVFDLNEVKAFLSSNKQMFVIASYWTYWDKVLLKHQPNGYRIPIVSNLFMVKNNKIGREMISMWWKSMQHTTLWEQITNESMLTHWPWEQERLAAFYNSTPRLFYVHEESKQYFQWIYHGPLCCIRFTQKHDIIRSLNETLMNQTRTVPRIMSIYNGSTTYEELVYDLYHQINVKRLSSLDQLDLSQSHELEGFWKIWEHKDQTN